MYVQIVQILLASAFSRIENICHSIWSPHTVWTQTLVEEVHVDHLSAGGGEDAEEAGQGGGGEHRDAARHRQTG